jgi:putative nucleotidyltransferase with HDIG domain
VHFVVLFFLLHKRPIILLWHKACIFVSVGLFLILILTDQAAEGGEFTAEGNIMADITKKAWLKFLMQISRINDARISGSSKHSCAVADLSVSISKLLGMNGRQAQAVYWAALLHDIGKIGVPEQVLVKTTPLDDSDWAWIRLHPTLGCNMIQSIRVLEDAAPLVIAHQEKVDGSGYPYGLRGSAIPLGARIVAVADAYDAMTTNRVYRRARSHSDAVAEIDHHRGRHFDVQVVEAFMDVLKNGPPPTGHNGNGHNGNGKDPCGALASYGYPTTGNGHNGNGAH